MKRLWSLLQACLLFFFLCLPQQRYRVQGTDSTSCSSKRSFAGALVCGEPCVLVRVSETPDKKETQDESLRGIFAKVQVASGDWVLSAWVSSRRPVAVLPLSILPTCCTISILLNNSTIESFPFCKSDLEMTHQSLNIVAEEAGEECPGGMEQEFVFHNAQIGATRVQVRGDTILKTIPERKEWERILRQAVAEEKSRRERLSRHVRQRVNALARNEEEVNVVLGGGPRQSEIGWVHSDIESLDLMNPDSFLNVFGVYAADRFLAEHVWEHLTPLQGLLAARLVGRFLKNRPGAYIRVAVPDVSFFKNDTKDILDGHWTQFSLSSLVSLFQCAGFDSVQTLESFSKGVHTPWAAFENETSLLMPQWGFIQRSSRFDSRGSVSIIIDACKSRESHDVVSDVEKALLVLSKTPYDPDALCVLAQKDPQRLCAAGSRVDVWSQLFLFECAQVESSCMDNMLSRSISSLSTTNLNRVISHYRNKLHSSSSRRLRVARILGHAISVLYKQNQGRPRQHQGEDEEGEVYLAISAAKGAQWRITFSLTQDLLKEATLCVKVAETYDCCPVALCAPGGSYLVNSARPESLVYAWLFDKSRFLAGISTPHHVSPDAIRFDRGKRMCFLTLVFNGARFLDHHLGVFKNLTLQHGILWEWHIAEGLALRRAHRLQPYSTRSFPESFFNITTGLSIDGTTQWLDQMRTLFPDQIFLHRPPSRVGHWVDKIDMANAALSTVRRPCVLVQLDIDELWSTKALYEAHQLMMKSKRSKPCAYVDCHFFIAPDLVTVSKGPGVYSHDDQLEWLRLWWIDPSKADYFWATHAPPQLARFLHSSHRTRNMNWDILQGKACLSHKDTAKHAIGFSHYAYVFEDQVRFKQLFYGYENALQEWQSLQSLQPPVDIARHLSWVSLDKGARQSMQVWATRPKNSPIATSVEIVPLPKDPLALKLNQSPARLSHVMIDLVILQLQVSGGGISRVWSELLTGILEHLETRKLTMTLLVRDRQVVSSSFLASYVKRFLQKASSHPLVHVRLIQPFVETQIDSDTRMLSRICDDIKPDVFLSTWYTGCVSSFVRRKLVMIHDMIPEELGWDLSLPEWRAKHNAANIASELLVVSESTKDAAQRWFGTKRPFRLIPLAVNAKVFHRNDGEHSTPKTTSPFLLVGQRSGYKGGMIFFQALRSLCQRLGHKVFVEIVGGGPLRDEERDVLGLLGPECVSVEVFGEGVDDEVLASKYRNAAALVYLSYREGFGLPVAEAMSCGCPVVLLDSNKASMQVAGGDEVPFVVSVAKLNQVHVADVLASVLLDTRKREARCKAGHARARRLFHSWQQGVEALIESIIF